MYFKRTRLFATRSLAIALGGLLVATPTLSPASAYAETSADLQQQLTAAQNKLDALQKAVDQADAELGRTAYSLDQTQAKIKDVEAEIKQNQDDLAKAQSSLSTHISSSYKGNDSGTLLNLVLNSGSFDKLISNIYYANRIADDEAQSIKEVQTLQQKLKDNEAELKKQEETQKQLVASKQQEADAANKAASDMSSYVEGLSAQVKQKLEEERVAAAEAAKAAAEKTAAETAAREQAQTQQQAAQDNSDDNSGESSDRPTSNGGSSNSSPSSGGTTTEPSTGGSSSASISQRQAAVNAALSQVGKPYGHDNDGANWDCNGLTAWAWGQAGVSIPAASGHYGYGQFQWMKSSGRWVTSVDQLKLGDLVFYSYDGGATTYHVAMYIGGGQVVHANGYRWGVHTSSVTFDEGFCGGGSPI